MAATVLLVLYLLTEFIISLNTVPLYMEQDPAELVQSVTVLGHHSGDADRNQETKPVKTSYS